MKYSASSSSSLGRMGEGKIIALGSEVMVTGDGICGILACTEGGVCS